MFPHTNQRSCEGKLCFSWQSSACLVRSVDCRNLVIVKRSQSQYFYNVTILLINNTVVLLDLFKSAQNRIKRVQQIDVRYIKYCIQFLFECCMIQTLIENLKETILTLTLKTDAFHIFIFQSHFWQEWHLKVSRTSTDWPYHQQAPACRHGYLAHRRSKDYLLQTNV